MKQHTGVRVSELLELVRQDYAANGKRSLYNVNLYINNRLMPAFGIRVANFVRKSHIEQYKAQRKKEGASEVTINRELAVLKRAFNLGIEDELIERKPTIKLFAEPEPREGHYEHDEFIRFQEAARALGVKKNFDGPLVADIVLFGYYSGWRLRECLNLTKAWIREKERVAVLPAAKHKNKRPKVYPLEGKVWKMVQERLEHVSSDGLLFHRGGKPVRSIRRLCFTICDTAKINSEHFFHNLRRSCTTNLDRAGIVKSTAMKITGHETEKVFDNYNKHSVARLRDAVKQMETFLDAEVIEDDSSDDDSSNGSGLGNGSVSTQVSTIEKQVNGGPTEVQKLPQVMAERVGFEPTNRVSDYLISSQDSSGNGVKTKGFLARLARTVRGLFGKGEID